MNDLNNRADFENNPSPASSGKTAALAAHGFQRFTDKTGPGSSGDFSGHNSSGGPVQHLHHLQRTLGNQGMLSFIQAKMTVGAAHDSYEREADTVADTVMRTTQPAIAQTDAMLAGQPTTAPDSTGPSGGAIQREPNGQDAGGAVQRESDGPDVSGAVQREPDNPDVSGAFQTTDSFDTSLSGSGSGMPLPDNISSAMGAKIGADFSGVRIHNDSNSHALNRQIDANAFTSGNDIYFGADSYRPGTAHGQRTIAHELTHTIQQGATIQKAPASPQGEAVQRETAADGGAGHTTSLPAIGTTHAASKPKVRRIGKTSHIGKVNRISRISTGTGRITTAQSARVQRNHEKKHERRSQFTTELESRWDMALSWGVFNPEEFEKNAKFSFGLGSKGKYNSLIKRAKPLLAAFIVARSAAAANQADFIQSADAIIDILQEAMNCDGCSDSKKQYLDTICYNILKEKEDNMNFELASGDTRRKFTKQMKGVDLSSAPRTAVFTDMKNRKAEGKIKKQYNKLSAFEQSTEWQNYDVTATAQSDKSFDRQRAKLDRYLALSGKYAATAPAAVTPARTTAMETLRTDMDTRRGTLATNRRDEATERMSHVFRPQESNLQGELGSLNTEKTGLDIATISLHTLERLFGEMAPLERAHADLNTQLQTFNDSNMSKIVTGRIAKPDAMSLVDLEACKLAYTTRLREFNAQLLQAKNNMDAKQGELDLIIADLSARGMDAATAAKVTERLTEAAARLVEIAARLNTINTAELPAAQTDRQNFKGVHRPQLENIGDKNILEASNRLREVSADFKGMHLENLLYNTAETERTVPYATMDFSNSLEMSNKLLRNNSAGTDDMIAGSLKNDPAYAKLKERKALLKDRLDDSAAGRRKIALHDDSETAGHAVARLLPGYYGMNADEQDNLKQAKYIEAREAAKASGDARYQYKDDDVYKKYRRQKVKLAKYERRHAERITPGYGKKMTHGIAGQKYDPAHEAGHMVHNEIMKLIQQDILDATGSADSLRSRWNTDDTQGTTYKTILVEAFQRTTASNDQFLEAVIKGLFEGGRKKDRDRLLRMLNQPDGRTAVMADPRYMAALNQITSNPEQKTLSEFLNRIGYMSNYGGSALYETIAESFASYYQDKHKSDKHAVDPAAMTHGLANNPFTTEVVELMKELYNDKTRRTALINKNQAAYGLAAPVPVN